MKSLTIVLLAWWFMYVTQGRVVGPFRSQEDCERIRREAVNAMGQSMSSCWNDGRWW
jgi:hypothetical protein